jgi:NADH:ubiquinone reductase (H+-translocating)
MDTRLRDAPLMGMGIPVAAARKRIVIVGAGFGGLSAARALRRADAEIIVIDRRNYHLFQPLLYQVATAALSPADIAAPIRSILSRQKNATVLLGRVVGVDKAWRDVLLEDGTRVAYDFLVIATGARHAYFGHDEWAGIAPGLKKIGMRPT